MQPPTLCLVFKKTAIILSPLGHIVDSIRPDAMKPDKGGPLGPCSGSCLSVVDVEILPKIYWIALFEGIHRYTFSLGPDEFKLLSDCIAFMRYTWSINEETRFVALKLDPCLLRQIRSRAVSILPLGVMRP